jgi:hypothetical protein
VKEDFAMRVSTTTLSCALVLALSACSSGDQGSPAGSETEPKDEPTDPNRFLALPESGVQIEAIGREIAAGLDTEYCEVAEFPGNPGEAYYVNRLTVAKAPYSHHVFINAAAPGSPAEAKANEIGVGNSIECVSAGTSFGEGVTTVAGTAKDLQELPFPEGVGQVYYGGQKLIVDYHYFNTSDAAVHAKVATNFHTVTKDRVRKLARGYSVMHVGFTIPPLGKASATAQCVFNHDVLVAGIQRHTHRLGTDYTVWSVDQDENLTELWKSSDWAEDIQHTFDEPVLVRAGEGYRYRCDFVNNENRTIGFGTKATDEMCNLFAGWWVVNEEEEGTVGPQSCVNFAVDADGVARGVAGAVAAAPVSG